MKLSKRYGENLGIYFAADEDPLDWGTFGAFVSRNNGPIEELLGRVTSGSKKRIIEQTYIGYGHASIGDMVDVKVFIEGLPIWLAFELEGFSRFRGQESSTRYIDFSNQKIMPYYEEELGGWYKEKIADYVQATEIVYENLLKTMTFSNEVSWQAEELKIHGKAIKARTFDICRGLIPTICTTNMVWYGSINELRQHLSYLNSRKLPFINEIVSALDEQYPETKPEKFVRFREPWASAGRPQIILSGELDFGSYRDLRRHRVGKHEIKAATYDRIHPWYEKMLNAHGIGVKLSDQWSGGSVMNGNHFGENVGQKLVPLLGNPYNITYACGIEQAQYIAALRTKLNVHATLRTMIQDSPDYYGVGEIKSYMDTTPDVGPFGYYLGRGTETVEVKA